MTNQSILIHVPATLGNFGGAAGRTALALDTLFNVKVSLRSNGEVGIRYFGDHGEQVPRDRENLLVRALEGALHFRNLEFTGACFEIYNSVPVGVGLGSSAAAVLAGLIAADRLFGLGLDEKTLLGLGAVYESRVENLQAAWFGGMISCAQEGSAFQPAPVPDDFALSVVVPATKTGQKSVPGLDEAVHLKAPGLLSAFVCGSGPAVGLFAEGDPVGPASAVVACFGRYGVACSVHEFRATRVGARDRNGVSSDLLTASDEWLGESPPVSLIPV